ncbi:MAG: hypothetical protein M1824_000280 [Vezdaea acicularis]|nr:MAG: hypothetical protein M1824_000280 [Vezdaea acicularis]
MAESSLSSPSAPTERSPLLKAQNGDPEPHNRATDEDTGGETGDVPTVEEPATTKLVVILGSIYVGVFLASLDVTIIATLAGPISNEFSSFTLYSWLASAYLIANAALQPLSGRLTDIFSRRWGLVFSNVMFGAGNLICGLARSEAAMITGRVVSGLGGGGMLAIATFVASDLVPLRKRGVIQGIGNLAFGVGMGIGGVFGGWVNDIWGWRYAFLVQIPPLFISTVLVFFTVNIPVKETSESRLKRIDFLGAFTLVLTLVLFLVALNSGGNIVPWAHPLVIVSLILSAASFGTFIYVELHHSEPIIPVHLMAHRTVAGACLTNWFDVMTVNALLFYAPVYFQLRGLSSTQAGLRLAPMAAGAATGSLSSGLVMKATGKYWWLGLGAQTLLVLSAALITSLRLSTPGWPSFVYFLVGGLGYGGMLTVTLVALIAAVDHKYQAVITSASYAFRSTGGTIGITIASAVYQNLLKSQLWARFGDRDNAAEIIGRLRDRLDEIRHVPSDWQEGVLQSVMDSLTGVFGVMVGITVLGLVTSSLMKEHVLHTNIARR